MMGITLVGIAGALFMLAGLLFGHGLTIAGSILLGSALITNELSKK
jgi:hypothetical protein